MLERIKRHALPIAAAVVIAETYALVFGSWISLVLSVPIAFGLTVVGIRVMDYVDARYSARIEKGGQTLWGVWMNGVRLGGLTDAQYASIQRQVSRDGSNAIDQLGNIARAVFNVFGRATVGIPVLAFWSVFLALAITVEMSPEGFLAVVRELSRLDALRVTEIAHTVVQLTSLMFLGSVAFELGFGNQFGVRNCYSDAVQKLLRLHFQTPVDGDIQLFRVGMLPALR